MPLNSISHKKADVTLHNDHLVKIHVKENSDLDENDIREINDHKNQLVGSKKYIVIFVPPKIGSISKEARELSASKEVTHNAVAKAIIVKQLSSRIIGNFFIQFNKPGVPIKLFDDEKKAENWLRSLL